MHNLHATANILHAHKKFTSAHDFLAAAFPDFSHAQIGQLLRLGETIKVRANTVIVSEGQLLVHVYGVMAGEVKVLAASANLSRPSTRASEGSVTREGSKKFPIAKKLKSLQWLGSCKPDPVEFGAVASDSDCTVFKIPTKSLESVVGQTRLAHLIAN